METILVGDSMAKKIKIPGGQVVPLPGKKIEDCAKKLYELASHKTRNIIVWAGTNSVFKRHKTKDGKQTKEPSKKGGNPVCQAFKAVMLLQKLIKDKPQIQKVVIVNMLPRKPPSLAEFDEKKPAAGQRKRRQDTAHVRFNNHVKKRIETEPKMKLFCVETELAGLRGGPLDRDGLHLTREASSVLGRRLSACLREDKKQPFRA